MKDEGQWVKVWAATRIPGPHPLSRRGEADYGVAWVDKEDGIRIQVLVDGPALPDPNSTGRLTRRTIGDEDVLMFVAQKAED